MVCATNARFKKLNNFFFVAKCVFELFWKKFILILFSKKCFYSILRKIFQKLQTLKDMLALPFINNFFFSYSKFKPLQIKQEERNSIIFLDKQFFTEYLKKKSFLAVKNRSLTHRFEQIFCVVCWCVSSNAHRTSYIVCRLVGTLNRMKRSNVECSQRTHRTYIVERVNVWVCLFFLCFSSLILFSLGT